MSEYVPVNLRRRVGDVYCSCCAYCQTDEALTVVTFEIELRLDPLPARLVIRVEFQAKTESGIVEFHSLKRQTQSTEWSINVLTRPAPSTGPIILGDLAEKLDRQPHPCR